MGQVQGRHYGMDWLRIGAFQLLILYHVGMAFVPWDFQVKAADPTLPWVAIPLLLTNPWRLSLLFVVSGYASAAMFARQTGGVGGFLGSRIARLGIPLLFGMAVLVAPQAWVWLVTHHGYADDFGTFWVRDYFSFRSIDGVIVPTWMHLWFVAYLLAYTLLLCMLLALPKSWGVATQRAIEWAMAGPALLPLGVVFTYAVRWWLLPGWEDNHLLWGDWSAHANYGGAFLFGFVLRRSEPLRAAIERWWKVAVAAAISGWLLLCWFQIVYPGPALAPQALWPVHNFGRSLESWCALIAAIGIADRFWNVDNRWRPMLAEAVFPFYLIHMTIIIVVGYWLLDSGTGPFTRFLILVGSTVAGCWAFYLGGRQFRWLRPLIGLKAGPGRRTTGESAARDPRALSKGGPS